MSLAYREVVWARNRNLGILFKVTRLNGITKRKALHTTEPWVPQCSEVEAMKTSQQKRGRMSCSEVKKLFLGAQSGQLCDLSNVSAGSCFSECLSFSFIE